MSKDKYPSIFLRQMETIVFIILQIFFTTRAILKIGEYSWIFPRFSWGIFCHVTRFDCSLQRLSTEDKILLSSILNNHNQKIPTHMYIFILSKLLYCVGFVRSTGFSQSKEIWLLHQNHQLPVLLTQVSCICHLKLNYTMHMRHHVELLVPFLSP